MSRGPDSNSSLDDLLCRGVAIDLFHAEHSRRLLEEIDRHIFVIKETGTGKSFFANLQIILERHLCLSLSRLYERYSSRYRGRTIGAVIHFINCHAADLHILNRNPIIDLLSKQGESCDELKALAEKELSLRLTGYFDVTLPKADATSCRDLDRALAKLKTLRDKGIAHHEDVDRACLVVPGWQQLGELVAIGEQFVTVIARSYLSVNHDLKGDTDRPVSSLRRLLARAGLVPALVLETEAGSFVS
jgi:hypothetical protein